MSILKTMSELEYQAIIKILDNAKKEITKIYKEGLTTPQKPKKIYSCTQYIEEYFTDYNDLIIVMKKWLDYKKQKGQNYKPIGLKELCDKVLSIYQKNGLECIQNAVDTSIMNNWAGLFFKEIKQEKKTNEWVDKYLDNIESEIEKL